MKRKLAFTAIAVLGSIGLEGFADRDHGESRQAAIRSELDAPAPATCAPQRAVHHLTDDGGVLDHATRSSDLRGRLDDLRARGVGFLVRRNSLADRALGPSDLHGVGPGDSVPGAVAGISALEAAGFVDPRL